MSLSMLHCEGEKIINAEGKQIFLRGTNLGGWLLDELWMGFFKGGEAQWDIVTALEAVLVETYPFMLEIVKYNFFAPSTVSPIGIPYTFFVS